MNILFLFPFILTVIDGTGFDYPSTMPPPITTQNAFFQALDPYVAQYETPIAIRITSIIAETFWNCVAVYHPTAFDFLTKQGPLITADSITITNSGTSETRTLCSTYAIYMILESLMPESIGYNTPSHAISNAINSPLEL